MDLNTFRRSDLKRHQKDNQSLIHFFRHDAFKSIEAFDMLDHARSGIVEIFKTMDKHPHVFPTTRAPLQLLARSDDKETIISMWQSFIDYFSLIEMPETTQPIKEGTEGVESVSFQMKNSY